MVLVDIEPTLSSQKDGEKNIDVQRSRQKTQGERHLKKLYDRVIDNFRLANRPTTTQRSNDEMVLIVTKLAHTMGNN